MMYRNLENFLAVLGSKFQKVLEVSSLVVTFGGNLKKRDRKKERQTDTALYIYDD